MYQQFQEQKVEIRNLEERLSKEQSKRKREQEKCKKLYEERTKYAVALNTSNRLNVVAQTAAEVRHATRCDELQSSNLRYQEAAAIELNINLKEKQRLTDIIRGLEQKNSDQAKMIRESEKADELRKHQQEKNKAAGIRKQQEAAAGVIKKRKRKSSSKTKPSSMESK